MVKAMSEGHRMLAQSVKTALGLVQNPGDDSLGTGSDSIGLNQEVQYVALTSLQQNAGHLLQFGFAKFIRRAWKLCETLTNLHGKTCGVVHHGGRGHVNSP